MAERRQLPRWQDKWSDGCTASPDKGWWGSHVECCHRHDEGYYYGGSKALRRKVDVDFRVCLISKGMPTPIAYLYFAVGARLLGTPILKLRRASWGFGDRFYGYSDEPAEPIDVDDDGEAAGWRHFKKKFGK